MKWYYITDLIIVSIMKYRKIEKSHLSYLIKLSILKRLFVAYLFEVKQQTINKRNNRKKLNCVKKESFKSEEEDEKNLFQQFGKKIDIKTNKQTKGEFEDRIFILTKMAASDKPGEKGKVVVTQDPLNVFRYEKEWNASFFTCCEDVKLCTIKFHFNFN